MIVIPPYRWDPAVDVRSTSVPADDTYEAWSAVVRYPALAVVTTGSGATLRIWQAQYGAISPVAAGSPLPVLYNEGVEPSAANLVGFDNSGTVLENGALYSHFGDGWWLDVTADSYFANRYRMFSPVPAQITTSAADILVELAPSEPWDSLAFFNIGADELTVELVGGPAAYTAARTLRYGDPISPEFPNLATCALIDLPRVDPALYPGAFVRVRLWATDPRIIHLGCLVAGERVAIGRTLYGTEVGMVDYSRKERDTFGNMIVIERGYTDTVKYQFEIDYADIEPGRTFLASRRAKETVYIGAVLAPETILYGFYQDFAIPVERHTLSSAELDVESIVQDTPAIVEDIPTRAVFIAVDGTTCITADLGAVAELCLTGGALVDEVYEGGQIDGTVLVTVLDRPLVAGETIAWEMAVLKGATTNTYSVSTLTTDCGQSLSVLEFPAEPREVQDEAILGFCATITQLDTTTLTTAMAVLTLKGCEDACAGVCVPTFTDPLWDSGNAAESGAVRVAKTYINADAGAATWLTYSDCVLDEQRHFVIDARDYLNPTGPGIKVAASVSLSLTLSSGSAELVWSLVADGVPDPSSGTVASAVVSAPHSLILVEVVSAGGCFSGTLDVSIIWSDQSGGASIVGEHPLSELSIYLPIGPFHWHGKVHGELCDCGVTWEQAWATDSPVSLPPVVYTYDEHVIVAAGIDSCDGLAPVVPGVLTLTPTVQCLAAGEEPQPDPVILVPLTLTLSAGSCGGGESGEICVYGLNDNFAWVNVAEDQGYDPFSNPLWLYASDVILYAQYGRFHFCAKLPDGSWLDPGNATVTWSVSGDYEWTDATTFPYGSPWMDDGVLAVFGIAPADLWSDATGTVTVDVTDNVSGYVFPTFELKIRRLILS